jgi:hypothetical protein
VQPTLYEFGVCADMTAISQKRGFYEGEGDFQCFLAEAGFRKNGVLLPVL